MPESSRKVSQRKHSWTTAEYMSQCSKVARGQQQNWTQRIYCKHLGELGPQVSTWEGRLGKDMKEPKSQAISGAQEQEGLKNFNQALQTTNSNCSFHASLCSRCRPGPGSETLVGTCRSRAWVTQGIVCSGRL